MIPRLRPQISKKELLSIAFSRESVSDFEIEFAKFTNQKHAIAFPYGRTALYVLMKALEYEKKEIILPAYTCVVVPHSIMHSGNFPRFIDCKLNDPNMNLELIKENISDKTSAIIATSIFGNPLDLKELNKLSSTNLNIIQDCAHSFLTNTDSIPTHKQGIAAFFGLNFGKMITSIFGGMLTTDDDNLAAKIVKKRDQILEQKNIYKSLRRFIYFASANASLSPFLYRFVYQMKKKGLIDKFVKYYDEDIIDMPYDFLSSLTDVEARIGIQQIKKYNSIASKRKELAHFYDKNLRNCKNIKLPILNDGSSYTFYAPRVKERDKVMQMMEERGIELGKVLEYSIPHMKAYKDFKKGDYINSLNFSKSVINLPMHINKKNAIKVTSNLSEILNDL